jgi:predicted transposase YbfD/YdcC
VALIKDLAIRLLSLKLTLNLKSILRQDNRDFTRNNKSTNYNNYNSIKGVDLNLTRDIYSL